MTIWLVDDTNKKATTLLTSPIADANRIETGEGRSLMPNILYNALKSNIQSKFSQKTPKNRDG